MDASASVPQLGRRSWQEALLDRLGSLSIAEHGRNSVFHSGAWQKADSSTRTEVWNPANGETLGSVVDASDADVDAAVQSAYRALPAWAALKPIERANCLRKAAQQLRVHAGDLAALDALDAGLPVREMGNDVNIAAIQLEYFAGLSGEIKGETLPLGNGSLNYSVREPVGVVVRIHPFNHPLMFAAGKVAAALAAGNTVVSKPAEQTPLSALALAEIWADVFPPGVFNLVTGTRRVGEALASHPLVAKVGVIGSVATGRAVLRSAADTLKKTTLELGGKNALIAYGDADPIKVAAAAVHGMNLGWTAGQSCGSTTRLYLHENIHDAVVKEIVILLGKIKPALPIDPDCQMGCLVSADQHKRVLEYIRVGIEDDGAKLAFGGKRPDDPQLQRGFFVLPTLFTSVKSSMRIAREEIFGPVMCAISWKDEATMLSEVNGLEYGLTASIWTRDLTTAHRAAARVEAGYIWVNGVSSHFLGAPFGGYKQSGLGREECLEELLAYTQLKNVNISLDH